MTRNRNSSRRWWPALVLLTIGLTQMGADLLGLTSLKGLASATMLSPAPKVFTSAKGLETFSTGFELVWHDPQGQRHNLHITQERYSRLQGPYNRRNTYGAALAYGPVLASSDKGRPLLDAVAQYGLCGEAVLLDELGVPAHIRGDRVEIHYHHRPGAVPKTLPSVLEVTCPPLHP